VCQYVIISIVCLACFGIFLLADGYKYEYWLKIRRKVCGWSVCCCGMCLTYLHIVYKRTACKIIFVLMFQPSCGKDVIHDKVKNLNNDPAVNHAVVFHGVLGWEKREGRSPR